MLPDTIYFIYHFHCHRVALSESGGAAGGSDTRLRKSISFCASKVNSLLNYSHELNGCVCVCLKLWERWVSLLIFRLADAQAMMPCNVTYLFLTCSSYVNFFFHFTFKTMTYFTQYPLVSTFNAVAAYVAWGTSQCVPHQIVIVKRVFYSLACEISKRCSTIVRRFFRNFRTFYLLDKPFFRQRLLFSIEFSGSLVSLLLLKCIGISRI